MVSKASEDFPEPLSPVTTVSEFRGISTEMFFRLCCRAPRTVILLMPMLGERTTEQKRAAGSHRRVCRRIGAALLRILVVTSASRQSSADWECSAIRRPQDAGHVPA